MRRYDGHNGKITVEPEALVVTRHGMSARVAHGRGVPPRRIPLQALAGVRLKDATRLVHGWIQLLPGTADRPEPTTNSAVGDPDVVLYPWSRRKDFAELHRWLEHVVAVNEASGVDTAAVPVPPSHQEVRSLERYGERPDIAAAAARMGWTLGGRRELRKLPEHLHDDETVGVIAQGTYRSNQGIAVLTDRRLVFVFHGLVSQAVEDLMLERITSVSTRVGPALGELVVHTAGASAVVGGVVKADLALLADAVRRVVAQGSAPVVAVPQQATVQAAPVPADPAEQLRQLAGLRDAGVLTEEEFAAKKAEVLQRW